MKEQGEVDDDETWVELNTKACPKCSFPIEKNGGCIHMTCKCGHEFCTFLPSPPKDNLSYFPNALQAGCAWALMAATAVGASIGTTTLPLISSLC